MAKERNLEIRHGKDCQISYEGAMAIVLSDFAYKSVVKSHTKRYHNCLYLLAGLSACCRDLMDFITEEMDSENRVTTNELFRVKFAQFIKNFSEDKINYSDSSIKRALGILTKKKLIRQVKRGYSVVNPQYFWKNDDKNRAEIIKVELEFQNGYDAKLSILREKAEKQNERLVNE